jgi:DNA modification methylase
VLPYKESREPDDERHCHPLQLDVIERALVLWSNPDEVVLTPFMGVGSEVYGAVALGRRGVGVELKPSYYTQAVKNCRNAVDARGMGDESSLFAECEAGELEAAK